MTKKAFLLLVLAILSADVRAQQVAEINLARPHAVGPDTYNDADIAPEGCESPHYKDSDGLIKHRKSKFKVELALSKTSFERGETLQATILMKNIGSDAVVIPWVADSRLSIRPAGTVQYDYEVGWFDVELSTPQKGVPLELKSVSTSLYSSPSVPESSLRIEPGQWVVVKFIFVIEKKRILSEGLPIDTGSAVIRAEWRQVRFTWRRHGCTVNMGYFNHRYQGAQTAVDVVVAR